MSDEAKGGGALRWCSCKASARDGQHMAWCPAVADAMSDDPFEFKSPPPKRVTTHTFYAEGWRHLLLPFARDVLAMVGLYEIVIKTFGG